jgi:hypothetical protein
VKSKDEGGRMKGVLSEIRVQFIVQRSQLIVQRSWFIVQPDVTDYFVEV